MYYKNYKTLSDYIYSLYDDKEELSDFLKTIVSERTVLNVPIHGCFYQQEFTLFYEHFQNEIESLCKTFNYTDKRKNDIVKQRKTQFAYWNICKQLAEERV